MVHKQLLYDTTVFSKGLLVFKRKVGLVIAAFTKSKNLVFNSNIINFFTLLVDQIAEMKSMCGSSALKYHCDSVKLLQFKCLILSVGTL